MRHWSRVKAPQGVATRAWRNLADAPGLGPGGLRPVGVQVPPPASRPERPALVYDPNPSGAVAQLAKAPVSKTGDSRFESWLPRFLSLALRPHSCSRCGIAAAASDWPRGQRRSAKVRKRLFSIPFILPGHSPWTSSSSMGIVGDVLAGKRELWEKARTPGRRPAFDPAASARHPRFQPE